MASKDGAIGQNPLSFDNLEDIPAIDSEDVIHPASVNVTSAKMESAAFDSNEFSHDHSFPNKNTNNYDHKNLDHASSNERGGGLDLEAKEDELGNEDKMEEEASCADDPPSNSVASSAVEGDGEQTEDCISHSFSFSFRPPQANSDNVLSKRETEHKVDGSNTESQLQAENALKLKSKAKKSKKSNKDSRDSDSSVASKKKGKSSKTRIKSKFAPGSFEYIEDKLRGQIFSGWIEERRWVEYLSGYRDVVEVDDWEVEMSQILMCVIRSIPGVLEGKKWINITRKYSTLMLFISCFKGFT